jgi:ABC-type ATPase with predicted acetyltransferase domain
MSRKKAIEREVEAALRCFEAEPRLADDPGFYAALRRRIRAEASDRTPIASAFRRRALIPALLILMVVLNIVTALAVTRARRTETLAREQGLTALVQTYAADQAGLASYLK